MSGTESLINALTTLFVTIDPPGLVPLFIGLTVGMRRTERRQVAVRGAVIAFCILSVFALTGAGILSLLGISMGAFRIAGGMLLFWIAFEMIFEKRQERKEKSSEAAITRDHLHNIAVFPLALPLISGPGAISATILLTGSMPGFWDRIQLILVIAFVLAMLLAMLLIAEHLDRLLGVTGRAILTRLLGVLLAALSVQFVVDGIKSAFAL